MNGAERVKLNLFQTEFPHILQWLDTSNRYLMVDNILKICPVDIIHYTQKHAENSHISGRHLFYKVSSYPKKLIQNLNQPTCVYFLF